MKEPLQKPLLFCHLVLHLVFGQHQGDGTVFQRMWSALISALNLGAVLVGKPAKKKFDMPVWYIHAQSYSTSCSIEPLNLISTLFNGMLTRELSMTLKCVFAFEGLHPLRLYTSRCVFRFSDLRWSESLSYCGFCISSFVVMQQQATMSSCKYDRKIFLQIYINSDDFLCTIPFPFVGVAIFFKLFALYSSSR